MTAPENNPQSADQAEGKAPAEERTEESAEQDVVVEGVVPEGHVIVLGPDGEALGTVPAALIQQAADAAAAEDGDGNRPITDLVEQPAKVMRIGSMIRQLLDEVKAAPLDEASRARLRDIHQASIKELESGLAPELIDELERIALPFTDDATPSEGELRIAQAQLVGWLEGLFHGIQTAIFAQQMMNRAQMEHLRRALPGMPPQATGDPRAAAAQAAAGGDPETSGGGMYL